MLQWSVATILLSYSHHTLGTSQLFHMAAVTMLHIFQQFAVHVGHFSSHLSRHLKDRSPLAWKKGNYLPHDYNHVKKFKSSNSVLQMQHTYESIFTLRPKHDRNIS